MKKKIVIIAVILLLIIVGVIWSNVYVSENRFSFSAVQCVSESPNGTYKVIVKLCSDEEVDDVGDVSPADDMYVVARIFWKPSIRDDGAKIWESSRSRLIFYGKYDGGNCTVEWMDEKTVSINGKVINIV